MSSLGSPDVKENEELNCLFGLIGVRLWSSLFVLLLFSRSVVSNCLQPHGLQHTRLPLTSLSPGVCSNSCPMSQWCHPIISSSVAYFSSCLQSFPASGSSPMSRLFASGDQSIGASASAAVLPMNIQDWFAFELTGWSLCSPRDSQESSLTSQIQKYQFFSTQLLYGSNLTSIHDHWKNHSFDYTDLCQQSDVSAF